MKEIALDKPIARGRTADIYDWDAGHVLKLFHNWFEIENIEYEQRIARVIHARGLNSPAVGELLQIEGRNGLIYERVAGSSMLEMLQHQPWKVFQFGKMLARLHAHMHANVSSREMPSQRKKLENKLKAADKLPSPLRTRLLKTLEVMPIRERVCHGDFHPGNILISGKDATIIDWIDVSRGNPVADVARTSIILSGAVESTQIPTRLQKILVSAFHSTYLKYYFRQHRNGWDEYRVWLPIVAGARLSENIPELEQWLVKQAEIVPTPFTIGYKISKGA
ncbi:MAG TPA: aminoglycoside phosphotransferase family protein [Anaerolineales bacterium]|nr:aminoglycoside phosphotransferase family protein [Anaerolineales bacterium]